MTLARAPPRKRIVVRMDTMRFLMCILLIHLSLTHIYIIGVIHPNFLHLLLLNGNFWWSLMCAVPPLSCGKSSKMVFMLETLTISQEEKLSIANSTLQLYTWYNLVWVTKTCHIFSILAQLRKLGMPSPSSSSEMKVWEGIDMMPWAMKLKDFICWMEKTTRTCIGGSRQ